MATGWIKSHRSILEHPLLQRFDARGLWDTLLLMAAAQPTRIFLRGQRLMLERGQLAVSIVELAERGGITRKRARVILDSWVSDGMLKMGQAKGHAFSVITICNFDTYQTSGDGKGPSSGPEKGQGGAKVGPTEQERENLESDTSTESHEQESVSHTAPPIPPDGGSAQPSVDAKTAFWREAKARIGGKTAGSLLGRWVKDYGEGAVFSAHCAAIKENPASYTDWMVGRLRFQAQPRASPANGHRPGRGVSVIAALGLIPDTDTGHEQEHQGIVGEAPRLDPPGRSGVGR